MKNYTKFIKVLGLAVIAFSLINFSPIKSSAQALAISVPLAQNDIPNAHETYAYKQYKLRPDSELSKLIYLIDLYRTSKLQIIYNGIENDSDVALSYARKYIRNHYDKEAASKWIKKHAYRAPKSGEIIYMKYDDGSLIPLRDLLLEQLKRLEQR